MTLCKTRPYDTLSQGVCDKRHSTEADKLADAVRRHPLPPKRRAWG